MWHNNSLQASLAQLLCVVSILVVASNSFSAEVHQRRHFILNEDMIREVTAAPDPNVCNPSSVLSDLFIQIGPVATVYPSENYYYFSFFNGGNSYSGSLHFSLDTRDSGIIDYACYRTFSRWIEPDFGRGAVLKELSQGDGVFVKKINTFSYEVRFKDLSVTFLLSTTDQSHASTRKAGDIYVAKLRDDSGVEFALMYNSTLKSFYFVLDPNWVSLENLVEVSEETFLSPRTGFAYYHDQTADRFVLIAVNTGEVVTNSPYDGPFDQLPENYFASVGFWRYIFDARPELAGKLTLGGLFIGKKPPIVFGLAPYRRYNEISELSFSHECSVSFSDISKRLRCMTVGR